MLVAAVGMWFQKYWAAIGFQAFLAIILVLVALSILRSSSVVSTLISLLIIALGGWLFWRMVRVLGRMRVPRPGDHAGTQ
jgi:ABC-type nickel/cobalt efflux system permease component RcnA